MSGNRNHKSKNIRIVIVIVAGVLTIAALWWFGIKKDPQNLLTRTRSFVSSYLANSSSNDAFENPGFSANTAPYTIASEPKINTKRYDLKLEKERFVYSKMVFTAGDIIRIYLTEDGKPVDFKLQGTDARSENGVFTTNVASSDPGGTYTLVCIGRDCESITIAVEPAITAN